MDYLTAAGRSVPYHDEIGMLDLPPAWRRIFKDWHQGWRLGAYGSEEAAIRVFCIFTNQDGVPAQQRLHPTRWMGYGFTDPQLEELVIAGLQIIEALFREEVATEDDDADGAEGKSSPKPKSTRGGSKQPAK